MSGNGYKPLQNEGTVAARRVNPEGDIVQFASAIYVVDSDAGKIELEVMRIGPKADTISFSYKTAPGSALPEKQYVHTFGDFTLEPGMAEAKISVPIVNDAAWNATKEFTVELTDPDNCELGLYLKTARVKVRDTSKFPDDTFGEYVDENYDALSQGEIEVSEVRLFLRFCKLMYDFQGVQWRTWLVMFFDQLRNAYKYMHLILGVYMVDKVFNFKADEEELLIPGNRLYTAYVIAACILIPILVFYLLDRMVICLDIKGLLRGFMGRSLFRKYMNYNAESRDAVTLAAQIGTLTGDVNGVTDGYLTLVSMAKLAGKIAISIFFTLQQNPDAWWATVTIPSLMLTWCLCRTRTYVVALDASDETDEDRTVFAQEVLSKMNLVAAYAQRPQMNELFAAKTEEIKKVRIPEWQIILTNTFVPEALGPTMVAVYTAIGAELVLKGELKLGVYLATISVFGDICDAFSQLFGKVMDIISTFTGLKGMFQLLNMNTDLVSIKALSHLKEEMTIKQRKELPDMRTDTKEQRDLYIPKVDRLELKLVDVSFQYPGVEPDRWVFKNLRFTCEQGKRIGIKGRAGEGRRTLMELLSGGLFPSSGTIFIPSHLRTLHVSRELVLLNLSMWQNLTFGNRRGNIPDRIEAILNHFEMKEVLDMCKDDLAARRLEIENAKKGITLTEQEMEEKEEEQEKVGGGANKLDKLREGTKAYVHLARAFIMNPEVMVLHRPFVHHHGKKNYQLLKQAFEEHKDNRGFKMDAGKHHRRRPRTIFFSADDEKVLMQNADVFWKLPAEAGGLCEQGSADDLVHRKSYRQKNKQTTEELENLKENRVIDEDADSDF